MATDDEIEAKLKALVKELGAYNASLGGNNTYRYHESVLEETKHIMALTGKSANEAIEMIRNRLRMYIDAELKRVVRTVTKH